MEASRHGERRQEAVMERGYWSMKELCRTVPQGVMKFPNKYVNHIIQFHSYSFHVMDLISGGIDFIFISFFHF